MSQSKSDIEYLDKKMIPSSEDVNEYYNALKLLSNKANKLDTKQTSMKVKINGDKPIGVAFTGDWHLGARGVDYDRFDKDLELIKSTDGLYAIGMGDYKDNQSAYVHANGVNEELIPQSMQDLLVEDKFRSLSSKMIAAIRGCHDDWDKKLGDKDFIQVLCEIAGCVNMWHGGKISIHLGTQTYTIIARHKYKYESSLNTTNPHRNLVNNFGHYDVAALAHRHYPDLQLTTRMGKKLVYLRSGTYKYYDEFGQKIGGYEGQYGVPVVIFYPDKHEFQVIDNLQSAVEILKILRKAEV